MTPEEHARIRAASAAGRLLDEWSVVRQPSPYAAPEEQDPLKAFGTIAGKKIRTSGIVRVDGRRITTESGSVYTLGEPDPRFVEWLKGYGRTIDPEEPIKTIVPGIFEPRPIEPRFDELARTVVANAADAIVERDSSTKDGW